MKTLEQLVKELNLKPALVEVELGRLKTQNGYSLVLIYKDNEYMTVYPHYINSLSIAIKRIMVRG